MIFRFNALGLIDGQKRILTWRGGDLIGDYELKVRFQSTWEEFDKETFGAQVIANLKANWLGKQWSQDEFEPYVERAAVAEILNGLFDELLSLRGSRISTDQELRAKARELRAQGQRTSLYQLRVEEEAQIAKDQNSPPFEWREVQNALRRKTEIGRRLDRDPHPPEEVVKCLECLQPMEWIWFSNSAHLWSRLCGCAGWLPICRSCKKWRKLWVRVRS